MVSAGRCGFRSLRSWNQLGERDARCNRQELEGGAPKVPYFLAHFYYYYFYITSHLRVLCIITIIIYNIHVYNKIIYLSPGVRERARHSIGTIWRKDIVITANITSPIPLPLSIPPPPPHASVYHLTAGNSQLQFACTRCWQRWKKFVDSARYRNFSNKLYAYLIFTILLWLTD